MPFLDVLLLFCETNSCMFGIFGSVVCWLPVSTVLSRIWVLNITLHRFFSYPPRTSPMTTDFRFHSNWRLFDYAILNLQLYMYTLLHVHRWRCDACFKFSLTKRFVSLMFVRNSDKYSEYICSFISSFARSSVIILVGRSISSP